MPRAKKSCCCFLPVFLIAVSTYALEVEGFRPDREVVYKTVGDVQLKLYLFTHPEHSPTDKRAAIVFFFGGGWNSGSPTQFYPHCEYLASRGMVALSADYRVFSRHKTSPRECVKDGKSAIRWIRQHAGELGIDPDRIAAAGGSAGGHVAAATGTVTAFNEEKEDLTVSSLPNALVLFNPVLDTGPGTQAHKRVTEYWQDISPMHNINGNTPATIIFLGTKDEVVPLESAEAFKTKMAEKGIRCDLEIYEGQKHGFFNFKNKENYTDTVKKMDRFLSSLGYLESLPAAETAL